MSEASSGIVAQQKFARVDMNKRPADFKITVPGVYLNLKEELYHADPCPEPSLSSSILKKIINENPGKARKSHPRLNPDFEPDDKAHFDLGSAFHSLMLGGPERIEVIDYDDFKKKDAQQARDAARSVGKIPIIKHKMGELNAMVRAARGQLDRHEDDSSAFTQGWPEVTLIWVEEIDGVNIWCRCRLDWLPFSALERKTTVFHDLKSCGRSAGPDDWGRQCFDLGYDIQDQYYSRGISKVLGISNPIFKFIVVETEDPFGLMSHAIVEEDRAAAAIDINIGISYFAWCMKNNKWPMWPGRTNYVSAPPWHSIKQKERQQMHYMLKQDNTNLMEIANRWYGPDPHGGDDTSK